MYCTFKILCRINRILCNCIQKTRPFVHRHLDCTPFLVSISNLSKYPSFLLRPLDEKSFQVKMERVVIPTKRFQRTRNLSFSSREIASGKFVSIPNKNSLARGSKAERFLTEWNAHEKSYGALDQETLSIFFSLRAEVVKVFWLFTLRQVKP